MLDFPFCREFENIYNQFENVYNHFEKANNHGLIYSRSDRGFQQLNVNTLWYNLNLFDNLRSIKVIS